MTLRDAATDYVSAGLSVIAARPGTKLPADVCLVPLRDPKNGRQRRSWKPYQEKAADAATVARWFRRDGLAIAIVCGAVSGHAELLDFDAAGNPDGSSRVVYEQWRSDVEQIAPGLVDRCYVERSPSGGVHVVYRCETPVEGNQRLAGRLLSVEVDTAADGQLTAQVQLGGKLKTARRTADGWAVDQVLIETRGEGGYFVCAPSPGYVLMGGDLTALPRLTPTERDILLSAARRLDESPHDEHPPPRRAPAVAGERPVQSEHEQADTPGDDYGRRGDVRALLERHGWTKVGSGENEYWRKPGATDGHHATLKPLGGTLNFHVFSTAAAPFEPNRDYSPFAVYATLEHGGDFSAAAKALAGQGFGRPAKRKERRLREQEREAQLRDVEAGLSALADLKRRADAGDHEVVQQMLSDPQTIDALGVVYRMSRARWEAAKIALRTGPARSTISAEVLGGIERAVREVAAAQRQERQAAIRNRPANLTRVRDVFAKAPLPDDLVVPEGWSVTGGGIFEEVPRRGRTDIEHISGTPLFIAGRLVEQDSGAVTLILVWLDRAARKWKRFACERAKLAQATEIVGPLAEQGVLINTYNRTSMIRWLAEFEAANFDSIPTREAVRRLGWVDRTRFLAGSIYVDESGVRPHVGDDPQAWEAGGVSLIGLDRGERDAIAGYHHRGTLDGWCEAIRPLEAYPRAIIAVYAALASPLLPILRVDPMFIEFCDDSSTGKTTALLAAASTCGAPRESGIGSVIQPWSSSFASIDRRLVLLRHLPMFVDDTQKASDPGGLVKFVYDFSGGGQRGRATQTGLQAASSWCCSMLSTGESRTCDKASDQAGLFARIVTVWGPPFGAPSAEGQAAIAALKVGLESHYGTALPAFVAHLIRERRQWPDLRQRHQGLCADYGANYRELSRERANIAHRLITYLAALELTQQVAMERIALPWEGISVWDELRSSLVEAAGESDRTLAALQHMVNWAAANQQRMASMCGEQDEGRLGDGRRASTPPLGWAGRWDARSDPDWEFLALTPDAIRSILADQNIAPAQAIRKFKDRGWLRLQGDGRSLASVTCMPDGMRVRAVQIRRDAVEMVLGKMPRGVFWSPPPQTGPS